jgi:transposase
MLPTSVRILVCTVPQDMRRSFDTLAAVVREFLGEDPQSGALYVFLGKRPRRVKVLWWDRTGYCLLCKRLHRALFVPPPAGGGGASVQIDGPALAELMAGVDIEQKRNTRLH